MTGPSTQEQWMYWKYKTTEQRNRGEAIKELEKLLAADKVTLLQCAVDLLFIVNQSLMIQNFG